MEAKLQVISMTEIVNVMRPIKKAMPLKRIEPSILIHNSQNYSHVV